MYRYQGCSLPNVFLKNGFEIVSTPYGEGVTIHDLDGLHAALGEAIVKSKAPITGYEFRFLRQELGLSQSGMGKYLGFNEQTVARWEKGKGKRVDPAADRLLRLVYESAKMGTKKLAPALERIRALEATLPLNGQESERPSQRKLTAKFDDGWTSAVAAA